MLLWLSFQLLLTVHFFDHHQFGLVIYTFSGHSIKIPEGRIVHLDKALCINGPVGQRDIHQAGERQHKDHKVDCGLYAIDQDTPQFARIDLTLLARP